MRRVFLAMFVAVLALGATAHAATGRVIKVLPHFLDAKGRHVLSPSLYERDAYQAYLRDNPAERSGIRFDIQWKAKRNIWEPLTLRVELRGVARGDLPQEIVIDQRVEPTGMFGKWTGVPLTGDRYKQFGEVTAWRVTLWEGQRVISEKKSFLW